MPKQLSEFVYKKLSELISLRTGLNFSETKWQDLKRGLERAKGDFGFQDVDTFVKRLLSAQISNQEVEMLASHLTIGETYLFREKSSLEALQNRVLPEIIQERKNGRRCIKIWIAGCSTGEEAYTIAIILKKLFPDIQNWKLTISATDINPESLNKAKAGIYSQWSFRDTPVWVKEQCFTVNQEGRAVVRPEIRDMLSFSLHNLADDNYPSPDNNTEDVDIILCRNVLMYFSTETSIKVAKRFYRALVNGGWLIVSQTELSNILFAEFERVEFPGAILYRKTLSKKTQQNVVPARPIVRKTETRLAAQGYKTNSLAPPPPPTRIPRGTVSIRTRPVRRCSGTTCPCVGGRQG
ncbi:MAG: protein-glutamate O-methyltransferase CheR [Nitrospirae bacterium]|nr:protein-glutamate O-methyltransferase CheR [Nitrospirota bacterium]